MQELFNLDPKQMFEALKYGAEKVELNKSEITDDDIQALIKLYATSKGIPFKDAFTFVEDRIISHKQKLGTGKLNKNAVENAAASVMFQLMEDIDLDALDYDEMGIDRDDILDVDVFGDLCDAIIRENSTFYPLKNPFENRSIKPYFYVAPDDHYLMNDDALVRYSQGDFTAFCTPTAQIVFNRKFSERMCIYSLVKGSSSKSKKYVSNGGKIPDHYEYIEFIIMHELLHYTAGDHFYTKEMVKKIRQKHKHISVSQAHTILNYVGDYINNWTLVKSGYSQLPIGLFSEDVNRDKLKTYEDVIDAVVKEVIDDTPPELQDEMQNAMNDQMDDHMEDEDQEPSQGGQDNTPSDEEGDQMSQEEQDGEPGEDGEGEEGEDGEGEGSGSGKGKGKFKVGDIVTINSSGKKARITSVGTADADGKQDVQVEEILDESTDSTINEISLTSDDITMFDDSGDGDGGGSGSGEGEGEESDDDSDSEGSGEGQGSGDSDGDDIMDKIDKAQEKNEEKMEEKEDGNTDKKVSDILNGDYNPDTKNAKEASKSQQDKKDKGQKVRDEVKATEPTNWKKVMKKMIPAPTKEMEDCYQKMDRSVVSSMASAVTKGSGRIKPGECPGDPNKKGLCIIMDNSGSVSSVLAKFNKKIISLLTDSKNKSMLDNFYLIKFSSKFQIYKVDVNKGTFQEVEHVKDIFKKDGKTLLEKPKLKGAKLPVKTKLFEYSMAVGTEYKDDLHFVVKSLHKAKFNLIFFTDADLAYGADNVRNLKKFFALGNTRKNSCVMFYTDRYSYNAMGQTFGSPPWVSVIK